MYYFKDTLVIVIVALILVSLTGYLSGFLPYPVGMLVLLFFLLARLAHLHDSRI